MSTLVHRLDYTTRPECRIVEAKSVSNPERIKQCHRIALRQVALNGRVAGARCDALMAGGAA
jgi:hypothetical protein